MTDAPPTLREESQRETATGILGQVQRLFDWAGTHPKRAIIGTLIGLPILLMVLAFFLVIAMPDRVASFLDNAAGNALSREIEAEISMRERAEIDEMIMAEISELRARWPSAGRVVVRVLQFERDENDRIIGLKDAFESLDLRAERTRIRGIDLSVEDVEGTLDMMMLDTFDPICVSANTEDWPDGALRRFLEQGQFAAGVACPIEGRRGRTVGVLAINVRTPIEENEGLTGDARSTAGWLSGWLERSLRVERILNEIAQYDNQEIDV